MSSIWIWWHVATEQILNFVTLIDLFKLTKKNFIECSKWSIVPKNCIWLHICMCRIAFIDIMQAMCFLLDCLHGIGLLEAFTNDKTTTKSIHKYGFVPLRNEKLFIYYSSILGSNNLIDPKGFANVDPIFFESSHIGKVSILCF